MTENTDPLEGLDPDTARAVEILTAIDVINSKPPSRRSFRDPLVVAVIVMATAMVGLSFVMWNLTNTVREGSSSRTSQLEKLSTKITKLTQRNDHLNEFIRDLGVVPPTHKTKKHHKTKFTITPSIPGPTVTVTEGPKVQNHHRSKLPTHSPFPTPSKPPSPTHSPHPSPSHTPMRFCVRMKKFCVTIPPVNHST